MTTDGELYSSQADTQPTVDSGEINPEYNDLREAAWGQLDIVNTKNKLYSLTEKKYTVGRASQCSIPLTEEDIGIPLYAQISKCQFTIERILLDSGINACFIRDESTNGTFVNGELVGKDKVQIISNNDTIALADKNKIVFLYLDFNPRNDDIPNRVQCRYLISRVIGKGGFGEVREVFEKKSTKRFAMKSVKFEINNNRYVYNEIMVFYKTCHENVVRLHDSIKTDSYMFFVLEYMEGGDLAVKLKKEKPFSESITKHIFYQCCLGLHYLHSNNIIHRDVKPGNILLSSNNPYPIAKIADFGLAKFVTVPTVQAITVCGTPHYGAPELMHTDVGGTYDNKVDVWSLGVILYLCLSGKLPFQGNRGDMSLSEQVKTGAYTLLSKAWCDISEDAKNVVQQMLIVKASDRISLNDVLNSSWIYKDYDMRIKVSEMSSQTKRKMIDELYFPCGKRSRGSSTSCGT